jgi:cytochrome P450
VFILNSFTHRDEQIAGDANRFSPERWLNGQGNAITAVSNHFSSGPQVCAGKELALFVAQAVLATLLNGGRYQLIAPTLAANGVVPQTFNPFLSAFSGRK